MGHITIERKALTLKDLGRGGAAPLDVSAYIPTTYDKTYFLIFFD
jgi:hypothetical protein